LVPDGRTPQIRGFKLVVGDNSVNLVHANYGSYRIVTPSAGKTFALRPKDDYQLAMWGTGWLPYTVKFRVAPE
jgi:hypothetical protein